MVGDGIQFEQRILDSEHDCYERPVNAFFPDEIFREMTECIGIKTFRDVKIIGKREISYVTCQDLVCKINFEGVLKYKYPCRT